MNQLSMPSSSEMVRKVEDMLVVGEIPDLVFLGGSGKDTIYQFMTENGLALDLMPYIKKDQEFARSLAPVNLDFWTTGKKQLFTVSDVLLLSGGYWYDEEIFEQAGITKIPETWEEFFRVCGQIEAWAKKEKNGVECLQMTSEAYLYFVDHLLAVQDSPSGSAIRNNRLFIEERAAEGSSFYAEKRFIPIPVQKGITVTGTRQGRLIRWKNCHVYQWDLGSPYDF